MTKGISVLQSPTSTAPSATIDLCESSVCFLVNVHSKTMSPFGDLSNGLRTQGIGSKPLLFSHKSCDTGMYRKLESGSGS